MPGRRLSQLVLLTGLLLLPILLWLALGNATNTQDLANWIDRHSLQGAQYDRFRQWFGTDDRIIVSWQGCSVDDPRLKSYATAVQQLDRQTQFFASLVTGPEAIDRLTREPARFSNSKARRRLRGVCIGNDMRTTCLVADLTEAGSNHRQPAVAMLQSAAALIDGLDQGQLKFGGHAVHSVELNRQTNQALLLGFPGALMACLISWLCLRSVRLVASVLIIAGYAALSSLALVAIFGVAVNGLLVLMPVLVLILTLSGGIHITRGLLIEPPGPDAICATIQKTRQPVLLSMATTSIGLASLIVSQIPAVIQFGIFSALSLVWATLLLLVGLPALWNSWSTPARLVGPAVSQQKIADGVWDKLTEWVTRRPVLVIAGFTFFTIPALIGVSRLNPDLNVVNLFSASSRVAKDHQWIEQHLFSLDRVELLVVFPRDQVPSRFDQLMTVRRLQSQTIRYPGTQSAFSIANLVDPPKSAAPMMRHIRRQMVEDQLRLRKNLFQQQRMLAEDGSHDIWRVSVGVGHKTAAGDLAEFADELTDSLRPPNDSAYSLVATGLGPLAARGQQTLFDDLLRSFLVALIIITPVIMLELGSIRGGLVAMFPNVLPPILIFGYLGWGGSRIDIGTVLTASVGLGIAIDDTVHFLHAYLHPEYWHLSSSRRHNARQAAIRAAIRRCGPAMLTTTMICCGGLTFFAWSGFWPVRQFAVCLVGMLICAVLADLILLPALVASRLGRYFHRNPSGIEALTRLHRGVDDPETAAA